MTYTRSRIRSHAYPMFAVMAALSLLAVFSAIAAAAPNTKGTIWADVPDNSGAPRDYADDGGGAVYGHVNSNQDEDLNLRVEAALKGVEPNVEYQWTIYCGPSHALAQLILAQGTVVTNPAGNANTGEVIIPATTAGDSFSEPAVEDCINGVGHIDFDRWEGFSHVATYVGDPIPYVIPAP